MAKERKKGHPKAKGPGRPPGKRFEKLVQVQVEPEMLTRMERFQNRKGFRRFTDATRHLIDRGLTAEGEK